ncbi:hypothetical protein DPMN_066422 [Dreissena polymorpha]|uniref:Uncharacterized protein n=1 Tax=Dreissena polymorpha TaxID=45954 RepID=A0A9D4BST7_DREPO|nr:hypothetical protein DPMN_066422 [Dreissena polymorpha]
MSDLKERDVDVGPVLQAVKNCTKPGTDVLAGVSPATRYYIMLWDSLRVKNCILKKTHEK